MHKSSARRTPVPSSKEDIKDADWKIENVVATALFEFTDGESRIDLNTVARKYPNTEYNPERFPGLILRIPEPKATVLVFSTGKMVITGMRTEEMAPQVADEVVRLLKGAKIGVKGIAEVTVQNIVASGNLHFPVNLNDAALELENAMYEPEVFPGLIYRMGDPKTVFLIFSTGKIVCTGGRNENIVKEAVSKLQTIIKDLNLQEFGDEDGDGPADDLI